MDQFAALGSVAYKLACVARDETVESKLAVLKASNLVSMACKPLFRLVLWVGDSRPFCKMKAVVVVVSYS